MFKEISIAADVRKWKKCKLVFFNSLKINLTNKHQHMCEHTHTQSLFSLLFFSFFFSFIHLFFSFHYIFFISFYILFLSCLFFSFLFFPLLLVWIGAKSRKLWYIPVLNITLWVFHFIFAILSSLHPETDTVHYHIKSLGINNNEDNYQQISNNLHLLSNSRKSVYF